MGRCQAQREAKLNLLKGRVKHRYREEDNKHLKTKMAYVNIAPKAPRLVRNAQEKHGTGLTEGHSLKAGVAIRDPTSGKAGLPLPSKVPRKAPLMSKTVKLMNSLRRR